MGIILCQFCGEVIEYVQQEKVAKVYASCHECADGATCQGEED
ncbi:GapA-binding peptide SR1P [Numidum massiliense]|nr:GapA-binding peptide SR1P [Numidum massiliense]